jgi:hypothetical protein
VDIYTKWGIKEEFQYSGGALWKINTIQSTTKSIANRHLRQSRRTPCTTASANQRGQAVAGQLWRVKTHVFYGMQVTTASTGLVCRQTKDRRMVGEDDSQLEASAGIRLEVG